MRTPEQIELARQQALVAWKQRRDVLEQLPDFPGSAREGRQEIARREAARDRERQALLSRSTADAAAGRVRVVVAHRMAWMRTALHTALEGAGIGPVEEVEDGATALGAVVAVQPDVVLVQQQLPWLDGLEAVRQMRLFAPDSLLAVQLDSPHAARAAREAGATLVVSRTERPQVVVTKLCQLVA